MAYTVEGENQDKASTERLAYARSFTDLLAYQLARQLADQVYTVSKSFPREEAYSLTDQMRRSARSVGAQIAEAWAKRHYERSFVSKLVDADGEQMETHHWIRIAGGCEYIGIDTERDLVALCLRIGRLLGGMIEKAPQFCRPDRLYAKEEVAPYLVQSDAEPDC